MVTTVQRNTGGRGGKSTHVGVKVMQRTPLLKLEGEAERLRTP